MQCKFPELTLKVVMQIQTMLEIPQINEQHFMENYDCSTKIAWLLIAGIHAILISWIHAIACNIDQFMLLRCCE